MQVFVKRAALAAILCGICCQAWGEDKVARSKNPNAPRRQAKQRSDLLKEFSDYRSWNPVYDEPIAVRPKIAAACEPAERSRNPHEARYISVYVNASGREAYLSEEP